MSDNERKELAVAALRLIRQPLTPGQLFEGMVALDATGTIMGRWRPEERGRGVTLLIRRDPRFVRRGKRWTLAELENWGN